VLLPFGNEASGDRNNHRMHRSLAHATFNVCGAVADLIVHTEMIRADLLRVKDSVSSLSMSDKHGDFDQELATASPSFGGHDQDEREKTGVYGARTRNLRRDRAAL
jgi:hypothetical protein